MRYRYRSRYVWSCVVGLCALAATAAAQTNAGPLLVQLNQAVSGGQVVNSVVLQGTANWYAGSSQDSGPVTLTASSSGTAQLQLSLSALGNRAEAQTGLGSAQSCTWSGNDGVAHDADLQNCWKTFIAFFPAISLQPGQMPSSLGLADLGTGTIGSGSGTYRHLQGQFVFSDLPADQAATVMTSSSTDIGLDPTTFLPAVLDYSVQPDSGSQGPLSIELHYANYTAVSGVQIPLSIQRFVNGSLQLDITISSAQTN